MLLSKPISYGDSISEEIGYWSLLATTVLKEATLSCCIKSVLSLGQLCNVRTFEGAVNIVIGE